MRSSKFEVLLLGMLVASSASQAQTRIASIGQTAITSPRAQFGHNIGDDYFLATYGQMIDYWRKLDRESDRMKLVHIGTTAEGRAM
ncbi:MAG TPA: hypothetical protein VK494_05975 [Gemmatimonadaceae bacterium]|nr:hypothetical protein [Gemmatimonadaceae bacterium]